MALDAEIQLFGKIQHELNTESGFQYLPYLEVRLIREQLESACRPFELGKRCDAAIGEVIELN